jgi:hypothetical protein
VEESRLEKLSVDKGLLRETEFVQRQLNALLKCDVSVCIYVSLAKEVGRITDIFFWIGPGF